MKNQVCRKKREKKKPRFLRRLKKKLIQKSEKMNISRGTGLARTR